MRRPVACALLLATVLLAPAAARYGGAVHSPARRPRLVVKPVADFDVTGTGDHPSWAGREWTPLNRRQPDGHDYPSRFKIAYSPTGLYVLMEGSDKALTATMEQDFMDLW